VIRPDSGKIRKLRAMFYHNAFAAKSTGLPEIFGLPQIDLPALANSNIRNSLPPGLSCGGAVVYRRTRSSVALCNTIAALAGFTQEVDHVG
jgi:hypothetical protein